MDATVVCVYRTKMLQKMNSWLQYNLNFNCCRGVQYRYIVEIGL